MRIIWVHFVICYHTILQCKAEDLRITVSLKTHFRTYCVEVESDTLKISLSTEKHWAHCYASLSKITLECHFLRSVIVSRVRLLITFSWLEEKTVRENESCSAYFALWLFFFSAQPLAVLWTGVVVSRSKCFRPTILWQEEVFWPPGPQPYWLRSGQRSHLFHDHPSDSQAKLKHSWLPLCSCLCIPLSHGAGFQSLTRLSPGHLPGRTLSLCGQDKLLLGDNVHMNASGVVFGSFNWGCVKWKPLQVLQTLELIQ